MNRETKFRGLRKDGKGWVYGGYFYDNHVGESYIITNTVEDTNFCEYVEVIPETVGQLISGTEIYEGDILKGGIYLSYEVKWDFEENGWNITHYAIESGNFEIIGNIHQTPEVIASE